MLSKYIKKCLKIVAITFFFISAAVVAICIFFDQAVLVRKNSISHINTREKVVALTFDDGPSPEWTPQILDKLNEAGVKATFFMVGEHVEQNPDLAKRVASEGHEIGNHSYDHHGIFFYTKDELYKEVFDTEEIIKATTGVSTKYFRPPKAWITESEKEWLREEGYQVVLWTLNSKDWVRFNNKYIIRYILKRIKPGDIILFHDSGGVFGIDHGDRHETVKVIPKLIEELTQRGYRFVTITELLQLKDIENK